MHRARPDQHLAHPDRQPDLGTRITPGPVDRTLSPPGAQSRWDSGSASRQYIVFLGRRPRYGTRSQKYRMVARAGPTSAPPLRSLSRTGLNEGDLIGLEDDIQSGALPWLRTLKGVAAPALGRLTRGSLRASQ